MSASTEAQGPPRSSNLWLGYVDPTFPVVDEAASNQSHKRDSRGSKYGVVPMTPYGMPDQSAGQREPRGTQAHAHSITKG